MKKRILSIALILFIMLTILPVPVHAAQMLTVNDEAGFRNAVSNATSGDTIAISGDFSIATSIVIDKNVTLDLAGHTVTFTPASSEGLCFRFTAGGIISDSVGGGVLSGSVPGSDLIQNYGGTLEVSDGTITASGSQSRAIQNDGTLNITGGEIKADSGYAILNNGTVVASGGRVITDNGVGVLNYNPASQLIISGATMKSTSTTDQQSYAAYNNANGATITVESGTVSAGSGDALGNYNGGTITVEGGTVSAADGKGIFNDETSMVVIHDGTVRSTAGYGVLNYGNITVDGGTISSDSSLGFANFAKGGMDIELSGGTISSSAAAAVYNNGSGEIQLLGSTVYTNATNYPAVVNYSNGNIMVERGDITASANVPVFYNISTGNITIEGGTYFGVYNTSADGSVTVDGGSVKMIQGATPKNSAGTDLQQYVIKLTNQGQAIANTAISGGEMAFTPADKAANYGFTGVKTDEGGWLYLWLPAGITNAYYNNQVVDITGAVSGGSSSVLPNFNVSVTVYLNDKVWTDCPSMYLPVLSPQGTGMMKSSRPSKVTAGVCTYTGLDKDTVYEVWGRSFIGSGFSEVTVDKGHPAVEVHYYTVTINNGGGISFINLDSGIPIIQGTKVLVAALPEDGLTFDKWTDADGNTVSTQSEFTTSKLDGPRSYTASAKVVPFDSSVTVRKNGDTWTGFDGNVVLSASADNADTVISGTSSNGVYTFSGLKQSYYVWAKLTDGQYIYTGQKVTFGATNATVDYYTVALSKGSNINQVTGSGTYLKGSHVQVSAEVVPESGGLSYIFNRWTEGGALISSDNAYVISSISRSYDLTAESRVGSFSATVTLKKDSVLWNSDTRDIHLTEQGSDAPITGALSNGVYTFSGLDTSKKYDIWDDETVQKTGFSIDTSNRDKTLNYFTVTVNKGSGVTSISGNGVYLGGSTITATAMPEAYYSVTWQATGTAGTANGTSYTVSNLGTTTSLDATGNLVNFTGKVTLKKDDALWNDATVRLSTDSAIAGTIAPTQSANGDYTFADLDPHNTYYIFVNGKAAGKTLTNIAVNATIDYYTITVSPEHVTIETKVGTAADAGPYLKGTTVRLAATLDNSNNDFVGWYNGSTLLSTENQLTVSNITTKQTLSAVASQSFSATVMVNGKADVSGIKLSEASGALTNAVSGTASGAKLTFENLVRGTTYYIFDGSTYTGKTLSKNTPAVTLQYYTVTVNTSTGISAATVNSSSTATVLAGASVTLNATASTNYVFSKWVDGNNNTVAQNNPATITLTKDMTLTAVSIANYTGGDIDISTGWIEIADGTNSGTLKILQGGSLMGDNIDPTTSITITIKGNGTETNKNILISATLQNAPQNSAVHLTLKDVKISGAGAPLEISTNAGDVELTLSGTNLLATGQAESGGLKKTGAQMLTIRSIDGTTANTLTVTGNTTEASGMGQNSVALQNVTIDSGVVAAAGYGGGLTSYWWGVKGLTINGGILRGTGESDNCIVGTSAPSGTQAVLDVTFNGGTLRARLVSNYGTPNMRLNGGNLLLDRAGSRGIPQNALGEYVYKTTFIVPGDTTGGLDVSKTLVIVDKNGTVYGMNDVKTFEGGKVYAYLPVGTAFATYEGKNYWAKVKANGTAEFTLVYKVNTPASKTVNGVTATAAASVLTDTGYSIDVTLSGTAIKPGIITLGLSGSIGTVAEQTQTVVTGEVSGKTKTFVFPMPTADVTDLALTMSFAENSSYAVTYTASNATSGLVPVDENRYYVGDSYTVATSGSLQRTGYSFAGWKTGEVIHGVNSNQTMGNSSVSYTALWTANTYTVLFDGNGATGTMDNQTFTYDAEAKTLSSNAFTRTGYTFAGWATSPSGTKAYTPGQSVRNLTATENETVNLYALWKANTYTVTFNGNGATSGTMEKQNVAYNTPVSLNANTFQREEYTFAGWKTTGGATYANGASITATENVTLNANWVGNGYTVTFNGNGATSGSMNDVNLVYGTNATLQDNAFSRTGYTFNGWNTATDGKGTNYEDKVEVNNLTTSDNGMVHLYAMWVANTYSVQFNINNGDSGTMSNQAFTYDSTKTALTKNQFLRSGYTFVGWNTEAGGTGKPYADQMKVKNLTADASGVIQLYAQWNPGSFSVNFAPGSGSGTMTAQSFQTGDTTVLKTNNFTYRGYSFTGWNTEQDGNGTGYAASATVNTLNLGENDSITLYAKWTPNSYKVTFNANGATGTMAQQSFAYDETATPLSKNTFTREGYTFLGWAANPTGTSGEYADEQTVRNLTPMPNGVVALYAVWKANTVAVAFDGNGANTGSMENQMFTYNAQQPLSTNTYQRQGYTFAGWNTQSSGRGVSYAEGETIKDPTPGITGNMVIYAQWQQQSRYGMSGLVTNDSTPANPIPDATVMLKKGNQVIGTTKTDANGRYSFTNLLPGIYNVVCTDDGKTVTKAETIIASPLVVDFILSNTAKNSLLELTNEAGITIPALVVDRLSTVADEQAQPSKVTTVKLIVTAKTPSESNGEQTAIRELTTSQTVDMYLDARLLCNGTSIGSSNNTVLEIIIPYDFSSKNNIQVLRYHDGAASALTKLTSQPTTDYVDGTWFDNVSTGQIFVYASKFSTYAFSYTAVNSGGSGGSGGVSSYPITIDKSKVVHGTLAADKTESVAGGKITITAKPDGGYGLHHLIITDVNGKAILYTDNGDGTYTFVMPNGKVNVSAEFSQEISKDKFPFVDVPENHWAYADIAWAYEKGVFNGTGDGTTFSPGLSTTRGMIVTLLWRLEGKPAVSGGHSFKDVKASSYYEQAIMWAEGKKIVKGYGNEQFGPDDTITREQMAAILNRYASDKGYDISKKKALDTFTDGSKTSAYAVEAMEWAVANGLLNGKENSILDSKACATRAEVAAIVKRFEEVFGKN